MDKVTLSLRDFLNDTPEGMLGEYLSLSITRLEAHLCIRLTTMDVQPVSYTAIIPNSGFTDLDRVRFFMQSRALFS